MNKKEVSIITYCNAISLSPDSELIPKERSERRKIIKAVKKTIK